MKKYCLRLLIFAVISEIPFLLFSSIYSNTMGLNVIFTLLFGLVAIIIYEKKGRIIGSLSLLAIGAIAEIFRCDYGFFGVLITFIFHVTENNKIAKASIFTGSTIVYYLCRVLKYYRYGIGVMRNATVFFVPFMIFTILAIVPICCYNNKKGHDDKHLLYWFYPVHLLALYLIYVI